MDDGARVAVIPDPSGDLTVRVIVARDGELTAITRMPVAEPAPLSRTVIECPWRQRRGRPGGSGLR
jgi:hypothetical protein